MSSADEAEKLISIFVCSKDTDITNFLLKKAIEFEKLGKSRTFLIYDEDAEEFKLLGYFTLALQILKIPNEFSNRQIKKLDGFNAKFKNERITELPTILIGQIAKNELHKEEFSGTELMEYCFGKIFDGQEILSGRIIALECKNIPYLIEFYEQFGFARIEKDYEKDELQQLIRILSEDELLSN